MTIRNLRAVSIIIIGDREFYIITHTFLLVRRRGRVGPGSVNRNWRLRLDGKSGRGDCWITRGRLMRAGGYKQRVQKFPLMVAELGHFSRLPMIRTPRSRRYLKRTSNHSLVRRRTPAIIIIIIIDTLLWEFQEKKK